MANHQLNDTNQPTLAEKVTKDVLILDIFIGQLQKKTKRTVLYTARQTEAKLSGITN